MRLLLPLPLLLPLSLLSLLFVSAPVAADEVSSPAAADEVSATDVWTIKDGTVNGGCDVNGRKDIIDKWHDESGELAAYALEALGEYSADAVVRRAVKTFFGLNTRSRGSTIPSVKDTLQNLKSTFVVFSSALGAEVDYLVTSPKCFKVQLQY